MKKVLFATTALVMTAGVAAAEVAVSGTGRLGVVYNGENAWNFNSRARVIFTLTGQTDGGLEFGGSFRADQATNANRGGAGTVFISGAFGKIEMGDAVGAAEALFGDMPEVGYSDLTASEGDFAGFAGLNGQGLLENDIPYLTGDSGATTANYNPLVLYTYSTGPISIAASFSSGTSVDGDNAYSAADKDVDQEYAIAAAYTFDAYTVGLAYEVVDFGDNGAVLGSNGTLSNGTSDKATQGTLAGTAALGNTDITAYYAWGNQGNVVDKAYGLGVASKFGATTVSGYVQKVDFADGIVYANDAGDTTDGAVWWGLGAAYDLGGGASVVGGISDADLDGSDITADLGVKFKF